MIFDPRVAGSLIGHLAGAANGASIARKSSFLKDKLGEQLFASGIRVVDDPLRPRGLRSHPFDGEGVAVRKMNLIEDGVLTSWFLDSATARELGMTTTGHASRGVSSPPSPAPTNLHLEPGTLTPEQLIRETGTGFYVTDLIGMGTNLVTGDYSRGAAGFWIENGELTYAVSEVTIAGHLSDMFRTLTPANDLEVQIRHQCTDLARGGIDRCRSVKRNSIRVRSPSELGRGLARGRTDRASHFPRRREKLDQERQFAGVGSRHRGRQFPARAAQPRRLRLAVGRKPGRSRSGSMPSGFSSSIRSTARAPISRAWRTGRSSPRWWRRAARLRPRSMCRSTTRSISPLPDRARPATAKPIAASAGRGAGAGARRRPEEISRSAQRHRSRHHPRTENPLARAAHDPRRRRPYRRRFRLRPCL